MFTNRYWLNTRKKLLLQMKAQVARRLGRLPSDLVQYSRSYETHRYKRTRRSDFSVLQSKLSTADIVISGDFHSFRASQSLHCKLVNMLNHNCCIAVEAIAQNKQKYLDRWAKGELTVRDFLQSVQWQKNWGFPWEHYAPIFELARHRQLPLLAIGMNASAPLTPSKFDQQAASLILNYRTQNPNQPVFAIVGDMHLHPNRLPRVLTKMADKSLSLIVIHQDLESIFFKLARLGIEHRPELIQLTASEFCINNAAPWLKWQSFLDHLDQTWVETADRDGEALNQTEKAQFLVRLLMQDLSLTDIHCEELQLYDFEEVTGLKTIFAMPVLLRRMFQCFAERGRSFFLPDRDVGVVSHYSLNQLANIAGQFVHSRLAGHKQLPAEMPEQYEALIWFEAIGFFLSKMINPHRGPMHIDNFLGSIESIKGRKIAADVLLLLLRDETSRALHPIHQDRRRAHSKQVYYYAAEYIGSRIGENIFNLFKAQKMSLETIADWMAFDIHASDFVLFYQGARNQLLQLSSNGRK